MEQKIELWMKEIRRYNSSLHLVSSGKALNLESLVMDCKSLLSYIKEPVIADLGTGSGIPGILYKIMNPDAYLYLIERSHNKCTFLKHIIDLLNLKDIELIESDATAKKIGPFNAIMARAFSPKSMLERALSNSIASKGHFYYFGTNPPLEEKGFILKEAISAAQENLNLYIYESM